MKNKQIFHVVSYYPPHLGGMENCVEKISQILADRKYKISIFTSNQDNKKKYKDYPKLKVKRLLSIEIAHTPIIFLLFYRLLKIPKNSVIHLHIAQAFTPELVLIVCKIRKIKYIAHFHLDIDASGKMGFLLNPYKKHILSRVLKNANKIICQSPEQKDLVVRKYKLNPEKIQIMPNGVGKEYFIKRLNHKNRIPHLLFVGRLSQQKNVPLIIKALSKIKTKVQLDIAGEGEEREEIENLISKLKLTNVTLHGEKTGNNLIDLYKKADVFVICSQKEGISLAILEAMASGLPIIGNDVPGIHELINDCGILINKPSPKNLSETIDNLLRSPKKLESLSIKASNKAKKYSWENSVDSLEKIYEGVINDN